MPVHAEFYCRGCDKKGGVGGRTNPGNGGVVGFPVRNRESGEIWYYLDYKTSGDEEGDTEDTWRYGGPQGTTTTYECGGWAGEYCRQTQTMAFNSAQFNAAKAVYLRRLWAKGTTYWTGGHHDIAMQCGGYNQQVKIYIEQSGSEKRLHVKDGISGASLEAFPWYGAYCHAYFAICLTKDGAYYLSASKIIKLSNGVENSNTAVTIYANGYNERITLWTDSQWQGDKAPQYDEYW